MIQIRELAEGDRADFLRLMKGLHDLHVEHRPDIYRPYDNSVMETYFSEMLNQADGFALVTEEDGRVCGLCNVSFRSVVNPVAQPRRIAYLEDFCVDENFRGGGVGSLLFDAAKRRAIESGADSIELMVWGFNEEARGFYEHKGMTERSRTMELKLHEPHE